MQSREAAKIIEKHRLDPEPGEWLVQKLAREDGYDAFRTGVPLDGCEYQDEFLRTAWRRGWNEAREKYGDSSSTS
jgi:ribosome modulation factor